MSSRAKGGATKERLADVPGALFDARQIDEVHVFVAPKLVGGAGAIAPLAGSGTERMADAAPLENVQVRPMEGGDVYWSGRLQWPPSSDS